MAEKMVERTESAYDFPLLIKSILHTGDIGHIDEDGYLQITDRLKDVIKIGGEWISSLELEDLITQHFAVSEAAIIGVPDEKWGERPLALVVLTEEEKGKISEEDMKSFLARYVDKGTLSKWAVPDRFIFTDVLAKTSVGKLNKRLMREEYKQ